MGDRVYTVDWNDSGQVRILAEALNERLEELNFATESVTFGDRRNEDEKTPYNNKGFISVRTGSNISDKGVGLEVSGDYGTDYIFLNPRDARNLATAIYSHTRRIEDHLSRQ